MIFYINIHILLSILYINFYLKSLMNININIANIATKMIAIKVVKSFNFLYWRIFLEKIAAKIDNEKFNIINVLANNLGGHPPVNI